MGTEAPNSSLPLHPSQIQNPIHLPTDPNYSSFAHTRRAQAIHSPKIPILLKWRCCQPTCHSAVNNPMTNTTHTAEHFLCLVDPVRRKYSWQPGYWHDVCLRCSHRACASCVFLEVKGDCAWWGDQVEDARGVWVRVGILDSRSPDDEGGDEDGVFGRGGWI